MCDGVGSALKAVAVKTENATEDVAHLDAFCIRDKGVLHSVEFRHIMFKL